jgi:hypothetical protein
MKFTVEKGKRYKAVLKLSGFESWASNQTVAAELKKYGFSDVEVTGQSYVRYATASWPNEDVTADLPEQISDVKEITEDA